MKICSLILIFDHTEDRVLLCMKKRGFGQGKWNGPGGKVKENESITQGAIRELKEEAEISLSEKDLEELGVLHFIFETKKDWDADVTVFKANYEGDYEETEEMKPERFLLNKIPYDEMWEADKIWLKDVIVGERNLEYIFNYNDEGELIDFKRIV